MALRDLNVKEVGFDRIQAVLECKCLLLFQRFAFSKKSFNIQFFQFQFFHFFSNFKDHGPGTVMFDPEHFL